MGLTGEEVEAGVGVPDVPYPNTFSYPAFLKRIRFRYVRYG